MVNIARAPALLLLCASALTAALMVFGVTGSPKLRNSLGGRRLQMTHGVLYGDEMHEGVRDVAGRAGEFGGHVAGHVANYGGQLHSGLREVGGRVVDYGGDMHDHVRGAAQSGWEAAGDLHEGFHDGLRTGAQYAGQAMDHGVYHAGRLANHVASNPIESIMDSMKYNPHHWLDNYFGRTFQFGLLIAQAIFAVFYFCSVVSNYPYWNGPTPMSCQLQAEPAPCATTQVSPSNCCLSYLCPQARAAHTFDKTGVMDYWCALLAMFFCPFCTLCWANACTDMNPKLGGEPANVISSLFCTWCCSCCVIAQDAESLDAATGMRTEPCGVSGGAYPVPYGGMGPMGPGMMPGQMMMGPGMGPGMYPRY